jgi:hypothetical protein
MSKLLAWLKAFFGTRAELAEALADNERLAKKLRECEAALDARIRKP